jgi:hypothetical protein
MSKTSICVAEINEAQQRWGEGLIAIGAAYSNNQNHQEIAEQLLLKLYAFDYGNGIVLFKPTLASEQPFRKTKDSALSYFVGDNASFTEDQGFALQTWKSITFTNSEILFRDDLAIAMGECVLKKNQTQQTTVHYTFGYIKDDDGLIKIILHHSSIPYQNLP